MMMMMVVLHPPVICLMREEEVEDYVKYDNNTKWGFFRA